MTIKSGVRPALPVDWAIAVRARANVLVTGSRDALTIFAEAARGELQEPIVAVSGASLPPGLDGARTLMIEDVEALDPAGQRQLLQWVNARRNSDTQVIAFSEAPLFPLVRQQRFNADLYYRLNTVALTLRSA